MRAPTARRPRPAAVTGSLALVAALVLGGCTLSGDDDPVDPPPSNEAASSSTPRPSDTEDEPEGPTPEELSAGLLALASEDLPEPLASQTFDVAWSGGVLAPVTVDVLELERTDGATRLQLAMSSPQELSLPNAAVFSDRPLPSTTYFDRFALEDAGNGVRHYPLSWRRLRVDETDVTGPPNSCLCPARGNGFTLSPEPIVMDVLYGPLPEGTATVSVVAPGDVRLPDVPVAPAATR